MSHVCTREIISSYDGSDCAGATGRGAGDAVLVAAGLACGAAIVVGGPHRESNSTCCLLDQYCKAGR